jgi:hypothetical protein
MASQMARATSVFNELSEAIRDPEKWLRDVRDLHRCKPTLAL